MIKLNNFFKNFIVVVICCIVASINLVNNFNAVLPSEIVLNVCNHLNNFEIISREAYCASKHSNYIILFRMLTGLGKASEILRNQLLSLKNTQNKKVNYLNNFCNSSKFCEELLLNRLVKYMLTPLYAYCFAKNNDEISSDFSEAIKYFEGWQDIINCKLENIASLKKDRNFKIKHDLMYEEMSKCKKCQDAHEKFVHKK